MSDGPGSLKQHGKANSAANKSVSIFAEKYDTAEVLSEEMVLRWKKPRETGLGSCASFLVRKTMMFSTRVCVGKTMLCFHFNTA